MVSRPPFQRLGIGALLNGPATAIWTNGDTQTVAVTAALNLEPARRIPSPGEAPASGIVDGTYTQRNGAVDLRKLELNLPASQLLAHGNMGAYPLTSPSVLTVDFHSTNLGEFDTVLRSLGLKRNGKSGTAALPVALSGQADFHGTWTGSLANPRIAGNLKATATGPRNAHPPHGQSPSAQLQPAPRSSFISIPSKPPAATPPRASPSTTPCCCAATPGSPSVARSPLRCFRQVRASSRRVRAAHRFRRKLPSPSPPRSRQRRRRRPAAVPLAETALHRHPRRQSPGRWPDPFPRRLRLGATRQRQPLRRARHAPPRPGHHRQQRHQSRVHHPRQPAGSVSATGTYDLNSRRFQVDATRRRLSTSPKSTGSASQGWSATGKLGFSVSGSGTFDDPQLNGNATLTNLALGGEPVGAFELRRAHRQPLPQLRHDHAPRQRRTHRARPDRPQRRLRNPGPALEFSHFNIDSLLKLAHVRALSGESALAGTVTVEGPLAHPEQLRGEARLQELEATVAGVHLKSEGGVHATLANDHIRLDPLHVTGEDTDLRAQGSLALTGTRQLDLAASGSVNLKLAETLDPDLTAGGTTTFQVEAHGPLENPGLQGRVDFQNGSLSFEDVPNGLSQLHGTLEFNQDRLEVKSLTAMSGGGPLTVGGYLAYQHGLYADLSVTGKGVRIRYPQGVSSLADATLHLQGPQNNLLLSGNVLITRFTVSPDLDFAALAAQANSAPTITPPDAPSNHIRLDVHILSSPQLNFQNAFAKLAGDVDLRLRGTVATPSLLGRVSITEGSAIIAGTRYDLQRGDISFTNPGAHRARHRPQRHRPRRGLRHHPQPARNSRASRPSPIAAILRCPSPMSWPCSPWAAPQNQQRIYTQQQEQALSNPTTDALLGGALNATVSSRIQKLFGAGSVKVDPNYLGPFGNSTSRIIVEEQLGRNLTLTYATDVNTTGQQLLQAEIAINRHVSLLVARDESGVFSMVVKATRRFR